jgi:hypothetical protein
MGVEEDVPPPGHSYTASVLDLQRRMTHHALYKWINNHSRQINTGRTPHSLNQIRLRGQVWVAAAAGVVQPGVLVTDGGNVCWDNAGIGLVFRCGEVVGEAAGGAGPGRLADGATHGGDAERCTATP